MSSTVAPTRAVSDEELPRLLALISDSDSVELKLTIPDGEQRSAVPRSGSTRSTRRSARCSSSTPRISSSTRAGS